ncbi:MAG: S8 family serine peptidase [Cyanobacteria bacterium P01_D01_bin.50]
MRENDPRRVFDSATELSINTSGLSINDTTNKLEGNDLYSFNIQRHSSFKLALEDLSADADVKLIRDKNANGKLDRGETIAYSSNGGKQAESISKNLGVGNYYLEVYSYKDIETNYRLSVSAVPFDKAGNSFNNARKIALKPRTKSVRDWVGGLDKKDYYKFNLNQNSNLNVAVDGLSGDADLRLLNSKGNILASSVNPGSLNEVIAQTVGAGTYYIEVSSHNSSETYYKLKFSASPSPEKNYNSNNTQPIPTSANNAANTGATTSSPTPTSATTNQNANNTRIETGTLKADTFTYQSGFSRTIFSGNGNVEYGNGILDTLNLSEFASSSVTFNYADSPQGGVAYNLGNGTRVFDAVTLDNGSEILFEGIEAIVLADNTINLSETTNDPLFNQQWNLHAMGVHNAWRFTQGSNAVTIGIQDTGLGTNSSGNIHPDLRETNYIGNNYIDESNDFSHGTQVQGTIAAVSNNGIGGAGINWISNLIHIDVVGNNPLDYDLATATGAMIDRANAQGKRLVINMSLAGGYTPEFEQLIANNKDNALFVIASGNENNNTISSPADLALNYGNVVAVGASWGATDDDGNPKTPGGRISYPNWWGSNYGPGLTLMAPSEFVSAHATGNISNNSNFGYNENFNGTSASTANLSGVASLIWSIFPDLRAEQIKAIMSETAYDLTSSGYDNQTGYGFVNADAAVRRALALSRGFA